MLTLAAVLGLLAAVVAARPLAALVATRSVRAEVFAGLLEDLAAEDDPRAARFPALAPADDQPCRLAA